MFRQVGEEESLAVALSAWSCGFQRPRIARRSRFLEVLGSTLAEDAETRRDAGLVSFTVEAREGDQIRYPRPNDASSYRFCAFLLRIDFDNQLGLLDSHVARYNSNHQGKIRQNISKGQSFMGRAYKSTAIYHLSRSIVIDCPYPSEGDRVLGTWQINMKLRHSFTSHDQPQGRSVRGTQVARNGRLSPKTAPKASPRLQY